MSMITRAAEEGSNLNDVPGLCGSVVGRHKEGVGMEGERLKVLVGRW